MQAGGLGLLHPGPEKEPREARCHMFYQLMKAGGEQIGMVWREVSGRPQVERIYLPVSGGGLKEKIFQDFPGITASQRKIPFDIAERVAGLYRGRDEKNDLAWLNWMGISEFAAKVLKQTCRIPRGKVDTYSGIAARIGSARAARAVGTALANNPFPIVIPCHRVVRTDGSPGDFGGGPRMKKELLEKEGITLDDRSRVCKACMVRPPVRY